MNCNVDKMTADYWRGNVTRREVQNAFDDYTKATISLQETVIKLDLTLAYLLERLEVTPEQVQAFVTKKMAEYAKQQAEQQAAQQGTQPDATAPAPTTPTTAPLVTL